MAVPFERRTAELGGVAAARLEDTAALSALIVAAAVAGGLSTEGAPVVRAGIAGVAVGLVSVDGHVVLHTTPAEGTCLVDIVVRGSGRPDRVVDVIARRLGAVPAGSEP